MILTLLLSLGGALGWGLLGAWAQVPGTMFPDPHSPRQPGVWRAEAEDIDRDPIRRNWCPYQKSRLVTFIAACKMEKFLIHSQQPCPQGALDCQKVMYRVAHKPVYQVKQKVLASVAWRCCPGFAGSDCQHHDPAAIPEPADPGDGLQEHWDGPASFEPGHPATETSSIMVPQEHMLRDLQNDIHHISNLTAEMTEANQADPEFPGRSLEQVLPFGPIWSSFNQSLHSLFEAIRNLSLDVEANRQAIKMVQDSTVPRADFQELGAKFEAKVQENAQRVGQLQQAVEDRLNAQNFSLHHSLSEVQANVDTKLKRLLKAQEHLGSNGSLVAAAAGAGARPEPESLQARLGQLQRNLSALHLATSHREEEVQSILEDMKATLAQHVEEIRELYSESDETFDQISKVEQQMEKLQVNYQVLRELRVMLIEKSLIVEENKVETDRQLLELNLTLQHLQGGHADLIKYINDCNCQKLSSGLDIVQEGHRNTVHTLQDTQVRLDQKPQQDNSSLQALSHMVAAMSRAVAEHQAEDEQVRADRARLRTQLQALNSEVGALKAAEGKLWLEVRQLHSSFAALLEDALRHEAVLTSLFGEEVTLSEEATGPLPLRYEEIRAGLHDAASGLREQALGWAALAARVSALEQAAVGGGQGPELLEPSHEVVPEEAGGSDPAGVAPELQRLGPDIERLGQCCEASWAATLHSSLQSLHRALSTTQQGLERHQQLFHSLFGNFQGLVAANVSLDLGKLQAMLGRKGKKQQKGLEASQKRNKKQVVPLVDALGADLHKAGIAVAFYASFSEGMATLQTVKFNTTYINIGSSYFPEDGYFRAPERGVYLFAVSIEFGPGPGTGQLVFGDHQRTPVSTTEEHSGGSTATAFAMAELQKDDRVWFELTQGSVMKRSPSGTAFGGFLVFKT
ncbi:multimerin-2 isoform X1 [Desmodus rotundus]|uniref:multimerin-2 isoform X1 n=1 Tax=Desmodus rotundus TaxID=9430 RepID=UPI000D17FA84|nr:multimerin-2 isoform X1 [Desmodus rotundus]